MNFQLVTAYVNLGGSRDNVAFRGTDALLTLPEVQVLRALHGGDEHVHTLVAVGFEERDPVDEQNRLRARYGDIVDKLFPPIAGVPQLPVSDPRIPTVEEVAEEQAAVEAVRAKSKSKAKAVPPPAPAPDALPDLNSLPTT